MPTSEGYNGAYSGPQIDAAIGLVRQNADTWSGKQDKLAGSEGQVVGFDAEGNAQAQAKPSYNAAEVGAVPTSRTINGKALNQNISLNATDVGADATGEADAVQGNLTNHINNTSNPHQVTAAQIGAVPTSRTVNGKALTQNITLSAADVGADASGAAAAVQAELDEHVENMQNPHQVTTDQIGAVPTNRTVNGKPLSANVTLTAADVSAVPTSRTVNGQTLSANITLDAGDVGADVSGAAAAVQTNLNAHTGNTNNPHQVTAAQVGALPLTGGTLTGNLNGRYFTGTWLQTTAVTDLNAVATKFAVIDSSGWIYFRTASETASDIGAATEISGTASLPASGWTNNTSSSGYYYRNVTISGIQSSDEPMVGIDKSFSDSDADDAMQEAWNLIDGANAYSGYIRFYAKEVPSVAVSFQWKVVR